MKKREDAFKTHEENKWFLIEWELENEERLNEFGYTDWDYYNDFIH